MPRSLGTSMKKTARKLPAPTKLVLSAVVAEAENKAPYADVRAKRRKSGGVWACCPPTMTMSIHARSEFFVEAARALLHEALDLDNLVAEDIRPKLLSDQAAHITAALRALDSK